MFFNKRIKIICLFLLSSLACPVMAAIDGSVGATSTGEITIRLSIKQGIQIENLRDIEIITSNHTIDDVQLSNQFCILGNVGELYTITAFSESLDTHAFYLSGPNNSKILFELYFSNNLSNEVSDKLKPLTVSNKYAVTSNGINCNGENNAVISLVIPHDELNRAEYNEYNGFLNLTIAID